MPKYPRSLAEAHTTAAAVAHHPRHSINLQCVECARVIARSVGPRIGATVIKLLTAEGQGVVILPSKGVQASTTGQHIGVRVGHLVYDNHFPDGVPVEEWRGLYRDWSGGLLLAYERPVSDFFGRLFLGRKFSAFASNRFQDDESLMG